MKKEHYSVLAALSLSIAALSAGCAREQPPVEGWQALQREIRDEKIEKNEAAAELAGIESALKAYCGRKYVFEAGNWAFPLKNYPKIIYKGDFHPNAIYGPYKTRGFNFFDGNKHGGHPAHDIFIRDKNQDSRDDRTKKLVNVVSMTDALVLSICYEWKKESGLRGGKYVWTYNPDENKFFYYAHLKNVLVSPGKFVKKGDVIGTVGRTGRLAAVRRSATHVHLMVLEYKDGKMIPYDYYRKIK